MKSVKKPNGLTVSPVCSMSMHLVRVVKLVTIVIRLLLVMAEPVLNASALWLALLGDSGL
jgi:hypothetical protein